MKTASVLLLASACLFATIAFVPAASADTCISSVPGVCGVYGATWCVVGHALPKANPLGIVTCDTTILE